MTNSKHLDLLMRALGDELTAAERARFERLLEQDEALRDEWASLHRVKGLLEGTAADGFGPHFSTRVVADLRRRRLAEGEGSLVEALARLFRPLAPITVAAAATLVVLNLHDPVLADEGGMLVQQAFGMPVATVETAEVLYLGVR